MQVEFAEPLASHGYHSGVVWTWADFREPDLVLFHKQFNPEYAQTTEAIRNRFGYTLRLRQSLGVHRLRLPALHIIAFDLHMAYRLAKMRLGDTCRVHGSYG